MLLNFFKIYRYLETKKENANKINDLNAEVDKIKQINNSYASDLNVWDQVTRSKLETEIQTYRSILTYQIKILRESKGKNIPNIDKKRLDTINSNFKIYSFAIYNRVKFKEFNPLFLMLH